MKTSITKNKTGIRCNLKRSSDFRQSVTFHSRYYKKQAIKNLYFDKVKKSYVFKKTFKSNVFMMIRHMTQIRNNLDFDEMVSDWLYFLKSYNADDNLYEEEYKKLLKLVDKWDDENNYESELDFTLSSMKKTPKTSHVQTLKIPGYVCLDCDKYISFPSIVLHMDLFHSIIEIPEKSKYN
jgi:hypothetical protein